MQVQHLLEDKRYLFWALQLAGWGSWAITFYLGMVVWGKAEGTYAIYLPLVATMGMLITLLLRSLYRAVWEKEIVWRVLAILVGPCPGARPLRRYPARRAAGADRRRPFRRCHQPRQ